MKRILLAATAIVALSAHTKAQTIVNGNFETWNTINREKPASWFSSIDDFTEGEELVTKTTDSRSGSAIKLQTLEVAGDIGFAFFTNTNGDPTEAEGGTPYTQQPTAITGYYKGTFNSGDSAILLVVFKKDGSPISFNTFKIGTNASAYTQFSFPLSLAMAPDSVVFAMASSDVLDNIENITPGNVITIDDISFTGAGITQQLANSNFDSWTTETSYGFVNWTSFNEEVTRTTQKYKGEAAAYIPVVDYGDGFVFGGSLGLGEPNTNSGRQAIPYTKTDDTLSFYYKFNSVGGDSATVLVGFSKEGNPIGGDIKYLEPTSTYQLVTIPLNAAIAPDSLILLFSVAQSQINKADVGSELFIDEVTLTSEPLNTGLLNWTKTAADAKVYPNPMNNEVFVWVGGFKNVEYSIADITGKQLLNGNVSNNPINVSELHSGIYFITLSSNGQTLATKKVVKN